MKKIILILLGAIYLFCGCSPKLNYLQTTNTAMKSSWRKQTLLLSDSYTKLLRHQINNANKTRTALWANIASRHDVFSSYDTIFLMERFNMTYQKLEGYLGNENTLFYYKGYSQNEALLTGFDETIGRKYYEQIKARVNQIVELRKPKSFYDCDKSISTDEVVYFVFKCWRDKTGQTKYKSYSTSYSQKIILPWYGPIE